MRFATISHLLNENDIKKIPKTWIKKNLIVSPVLNIRGTKGYVIGLKVSPKQVMGIPKKNIRKMILEAALFAQNELNVELIQLGALTTSVTKGGIWLTEQKEYNGFVTHGDSYTAAVTCKAVLKVLKMYNRKISDQKLAVVGAYGIIGEAVSKILVPKFNNSILIGRRKEKLDELKAKLNGNFETSIELETENADILVTATSHPTALLKEQDLKRNAIIVDVSQPPNLSLDICEKRPDIIRIDGGYVNLPVSHSIIHIPGFPKGKIYACVAELIMQALENDKDNYVGSIDLKHLKKTEEWGKKHDFTLKELTNFGKKIS